MSLLVDIKSKLNSFDMNISLTTNTNRIGILGASGAGKSMLLKYISGIVSPDEGIISLDEKILYDSSSSINIKPQKRNVAYMFQNYALFPNMTVKENIEIVIDASKEEKSKRSLELMKKFRIDNLANKKPKSLSGGQQQRVALARIIAYEPKLILLDEPFSALDNDLKEKLQMELEDMIDDYDGIVVMVSHSREEIYRFSKELIIIDGGRIVEHGLTKDIFSRPNTVQGAKMIGISNIIPAYVDDGGSIHIDDIGIEIKGYNIKVSHIGIRDTDLKIVDEGIEENSSNTGEEDYKAKYYIDAKIENIYEGIECTKIYFSLWSASDKRSEISDKIYCCRINNGEYCKNIFEKNIIKLSINKEDILFINE